MPNVALNLTAARVALNLVAQQAILERNKSDMLQLLHQVKSNLQVADINKALIKQVDDIQQLVVALPELKTGQAVKALRALNQSLSQLKFKLPVKAHKVKDEKVTSWSGAWHDSWNHLRSLLIIRSNNTVGQALLTNANRQQTALGLHMLIQQAIWAAMVQPQQFNGAVLNLREQIERSRNLIRHSKSGLSS